MLVRNGRSSGVAGRKSNRTMVIRMVKEMRWRMLPCLLIAFVLLVAGASATTSTAEITVTDYNLEPGYLFTGDTGILTVTIQNTGDEMINIYSAKLEPPTGVSGFRVLNDLTYESVGSLGIDDSRTFTFTFRADVAEGVYYPKFYLDLEDDGCFRQYIPVEVKNTELTVAVSEVPDSFNEGVQSEVKISVGNPRQGSVNGVSITPSGEGITVTPKTGFIGSLDSDASQEVAFEITPSQETTVEFTVSYRNGMNDHSTSVTLPIEFAEDKLGAETVLNNIAFESSGQYNTVTGDITNAGLKNAYSVTVTVGSPATAVDPNQIYVIGELEPDDFSSFEVTYTSSGSTLPVIVTYKDIDGNSFTKTFEVTQSTGDVMSADGTSSSSGISSGSSDSSGGPSGSRGGGMSLFSLGGGPGGAAGGASASIPIIPIGIVLVLVLVLVIVAWKKGYIRKLKERIPRRKKIEDDDDDHPNR